MTVSKMSVNIYSSKTSVTHSLLKRKRHGKMKNECVFIQIDVVCIII